jgi:hypothetical protein
MTKFLAILLLALTANHINAQYGDYGAKVCNYFFYQFSVNNFVISFFMNELRISALRKNSY